MGNFMICGKLCDDAKISNQEIDCKIEQSKKEVLISNLLLKIDYLEEKIKDLKDDVKVNRIDIQYDLRELKNNVIILIKLIK